MESFSCISRTFHQSTLQSCWPLTCSQTQPQPRACTVPCPYLARVRAHIEVRAGLDWTGRLSVKQAVQYLDLLRREQLPSHLLPEEVPPTVAMPVGQRWLLQTCTEKTGKRSEVRGVVNGGYFREEGDKGGVCESGVYNRGRTLDDDRGTWGGVKAWVDKINQWSKCGERSLS